MTVPNFQLWKTMVEGNLGGKPFSKLRAESLDGSMMDPLNSADHGQTLPPQLLQLQRSSATTWQLGAEIPLGTPGTRQCIEVSAGSGAQVWEFPCENLQADEIASRWGDLGGELLSRPIYSAFVGLSAPDAVATVMAAAQNLGKPRHDLCFHFDPASLVLDQAWRAETAAELVEQVGVQAMKLGADATPGSLFRLSSRAVHRRGASTSQEIGFILSSVLWLARTLRKNAKERPLALEHVSFELTCGPDFVTEIAKIRALRAALRVLCAQAGIPSHDEAPTIHVRFAERFLSCYDPSINLLRAVACGFAAACAGAQRLILLPHDLLSGVTHPHSLRLAQNIQHILRSEAHLDRVQDPGAGSWTIESLTAAFAEAGWHEFQKLERAGGVMAAQQDGSWLAEVEQNRQKMAEKVAKRMAPITGVSEYPLAEEASAASGRSRRNQLVSSRPTAPIAPDLIYHPDNGHWRLAESFEKLRVRVENDLQHADVFLANWGQHAAINARSTFAQHAFAAGGFRVHSGTATTELATLLEGAQTSKCPIVVLCASDSEHEMRGHDLVTALRQIPNIWLVVAAKPTALPETVVAAVDDFVFLRSDLLQSLAKATQYLLNAQQGKEACP